MINTWWGIDQTIPAGAASSRPRMLGPASDVHEHLSFTKDETANASWRRSKLSFLSAQE
jgi:hypothetical protein